MARKPGSLESKAEVDKLAGRVLLFISIVAGILGLFYGWLQIAPYLGISALASVQPEVARKFILAVYYVCWVFGAPFDVEIQRAVYVSDPDRGRMPVDAATAIFLFGVIAAVLLWAVDNDGRFTVALNVFVLANIVGMQFIILRRVRPVIRASEQHYAKDKQFAELERLRLVEAYIAGKWQWYRFICLLVIVGAIDLIFFSDTVREQLSSAAHSIMPNLGAVTTSSLLIDLFLVIFVIVSEVWIWLMRWRTRSFLTVISILKDRYHLAPRAGTR